MSEPETDQDFRERLLKAMPDDASKGHVMIAIGSSLDAIGRMHGISRKGLPEGSFTDPVVEAFRDVERSLDLGHPQKALGESDEGFAARCKAYWGLPS
jgi:hypothetical protein